MSEAATETKTEVVPAAPLNLGGAPVVVERNGIAKEYKLFKFLKGDSKGAEYPGPDVQDVTKFEETVDWFGKSVVLNVLQNFAKAVHQKLRRDCTNETTGEFDLAKFLRECKDFDVTGLTLKGISDKIDELQAEQGARIAKATPQDFGDTAWQTETVRLNEEITNYMAKWEDKKRTKSTDVDPQPSVVA